jgi:FkbM family methyltransferase
MKVYFKHGRWGVFLLIEGDLISEHFNLYGQWAETEIDLCRALLSDDSVVIEAGANLGTHTVALSKICPSGQIYAYEAQSKVFDLLSANVSLNQCDNVCAINAALGEIEGTMDIETGDYSQAFNYGSFSLEKGFSTEQLYDGPITLETVGIHTVDQCVTENKLERVDLLKLDVEGYEGRVLQGAISTLDRFAPDLIVEAVYEEQTNQICQMLTAKGYQAHWVAAPRYLPSNYNGVTVAAAGYDFSLLFRSRNKKVPHGLQPFQSVEDIKNGIAIVEKFEFH